MARKKTQRKQKTTLVQHRTPNLSTLLEEAKSGDCAQAVRAYLHAGGSPAVLNQLQGYQHQLHLPMLHSMAFTNSHPHTELAESVRLLIDAGADINAKAVFPDGDERTALMCAAERSCCTGVLCVLLQAGADACASSSLKHLTILHLVALGRSTARCELLLTQADALLEMRDVDGLTALMYAALHGRLDNVQLLLQHGADVNAANSRGCTALIAAAQTTNTAVAQLLLDFGADIRAADIKGQNALSKATIKGHVSMMEFLKQRGLSVHAVDSAGSTLLMLAISAQQRVAAEWLLQQGVAIDTVKNSGFTALHIACVSDIYDNAAIVEVLLANGADVHKCADAQLTALDMAAHKGNVECVKALIAAGADVNNIVSIGYRPLHAAVMRDRAEVVKVLLEHGAAAVLNEIVHVRCSGDAPQYESGTALMMCADTAIAKLLLAAGVDVHVTNDSGYTCLHVAAEHGLPVPILCLLIKAGANVHAVNNEGKTAAQLAHENGHTLIEQLLNRAARD
jgi:ankyrin repeat protein